VRVVDVLPGFGFVDLATVEVDATTNQTHMTAKPDLLECEILVVGAGPVGLALAGDLGWRDRQCIVVDRGDGSIFQPKMDLVGIRTM
jgi:ribulose 1,5-bisphosphate synthetase/thiazole synthase